MARDGSAVVEKEQGLRRSNKTYKASKWVEAGAFVDGILMLDLEPS